MNTIPYTISRVHQTLPRPAYYSYWLTLYYGNMISTLIYYTNYNYTILRNDDYTATYIL